jgi:GxxExxY protein
MNATRTETTLLHGELSGQIIGAFFQVYNDLGFGFVESVYQRALPGVLLGRGIPSEREVPFDVCYRGEPIGHYRADLVVDGKVIVEIKATDRIIPVHETQLLNYLKATGIALGLVLNFGPRPTFRRLILSPSQRDSWFCTYDWRTELKNRGNGHG